MIHITKKAHTLCPVLVTIPSTQDTYESVLIVFDDGSYKLLNWEDDLTLMGIKTTYSSETMSFILWVNECVYIIETYNQTLQFNEGPRVIANKVLKDKVVMGESVEPESLESVLSKLAPNAPRPKHITHTPIKH